MRVIGRRQRIVGAGPLRASTRLRLLLGIRWLVDCILSYRRVYRGGEAEVGAQPHARDDENKWNSM